MICLIACLMRHNMTNMYLVHTYVSIFSMYCTRKLTDNIRILCIISCTVTCTFLMYSTWIVLILRHSFTCNPYERKTCLHPLCTGDASRELEALRKRNYELEQQHESAAPRPDTHLVRTYCTFLVTLISSIELMHCISSTAPLTNYSNDCSTRCIAH